MKHLGGIITLKGKILAYRLKETQLHVADISLAKSSTEATIKVNVQL